MQLSQKALLTALLAAPLLSNQSYAQSWNNRDFCQIVIQNDGAMRPNVDATEISSKEAGGYAGTAIVTAKRSRYRLVLETPFGFSHAPVGGNDNAVFATTFSGYGSTNFSERPGETSVRVKRGTTNVEVNFMAKKLSGNFQAGNYTSTVTMRCE